MARNADKYTIFKNIGTLLTLAGAAQKDGRQIKESDLDLILKAAMVVKSGEIKWVGLQKKLPKEYSKNSKEIDLQGQTVLPGFVECHTHLIYSGSRAHEFELRNQGLSYQEIAARGGGILHTMQKTRQASAKQLLKSSQERVQRFIEQGVTTLEIKSGYALDFENEIKCLQIAKSLQKLQSIRIVPTYLGAHALPPEFKTYDMYLSFIMEKVLPVLRKRKLTNRIDIFIEKGFFSEAQARPFLQQAKLLGFQVVIHADQLSLSGGADLAVELEGLSADHLIQITDKEIQRLAKSQVTCVLLPAADLYMKCAYPPVRKLIEAGARVALATDFNPGSSPTQDLNLVGLLARLEMKMSLPEVISAYTYGAATALGLQSTAGQLTPGYSADFISTDMDWTGLFYSIGSNIPQKVFSSGHELLIG